jgi:anaerobic selenocysteine-containing dehydrogenase
MDSSVRTAMDATTHRSICRICTNRCAVIVHVREGRVVKVVGDAEDPLYGGYTCVKGRAQPDLLNHPERLLHSLKRTPTGFTPVRVADALDDIAERLAAIRAAHGPRAITGFAGHLRGMPDGPLLTYDALFELIGSSMKYDPNTIDKGGKQIAAAMHGRWLAPAQEYDDPDVVLLVGANPLLTYTGFPAGNPRRWLDVMLARGMRLVVIDPRLTEVARKATLHLRARPGHDPEILAALVHVILDERLHDADFIAENVTGVEALRRAVAPFGPDVVAGRVGVDGEVLRAAARAFATARRGYAFAGTGPSMSGQGSLTEYLILVLMTLCGRWLRAGEVVRAVPTLSRVPEFRSQAEPPRPWRTGAPTRVRSLAPTTAGMPTATLADEILTSGPGQVRALIGWSGNPAISFPDQLKTMRALASLELLVQVDPWLTSTAELAHYVAPTMPLEAAATTMRLDGLASRIGFGFDRPYANYTPPVVSPPPGSEVIEEWRFFQQLYERVRPMLVAEGIEVPEISPAISAQSADDLIDLMAAGSRVPVEVVRARGRGAVYLAQDVIVEAREREWTGRLDVGNAEMLADLALIARAGPPKGGADGEFPYRLLCRRMNHVHNSIRNVPAAHRDQPYNPAFVHPDDLAELGMLTGEIAEIRSAAGSITAVVEADSTMQRGSVAMAFGFGGPPATDGRVREIGSSPSRLVADGEVFDRYTGQPRMSNVPVRMTPIH